MIAALVFAITLSVDSSGVPGMEGSRNVTSTAFVVAGLLWLPLVGSKAAFPWSSFLLHWRFSVMAFTHRLYGTIVAVAAVVVTAIVAIVSPGWWIFAYAIAAIAWGVATAIVTRRVFDAQMAAEAAG